MSDTTNIELLNKAIRAKEADDTADPLIYIIVFFILFLIMLAILSWALDVWYKGNQCSLNPNAWCFDDWRCETVCVTGQAPPNISDCFYQPFAVGPTGLFQCLIGVDSVVGQLCFTPPENQPHTPSCDCVLSGSAEPNSCMAGCPRHPGQVPSGSLCCCCPGSAGCANTTLPPECQGTGQGGTTVYCRNQVVT